jgi:hypothetical protein
MIKCADSDLEAVVAGGLMVQVVEVHGKHACDS